MLGGSGREHFPWEGGKVSVGQLSLVVVVEAIRRRCTIWVLGGRVMCDE